jgi:5'-nucleotidase
LRRTRLSLAAALALATSVGVVAAPTASAAPKAKPDVPVQLIAMNDFHGRIANTTGGDSLLFVNDGGVGPDGKAGTADDGSILVGGSANIASTVKQLQASFTAASGEKSGSWFVGAGDLISGSPYESSVFKDEPTIEVLNAMGLDASSVGNHEFDRGTEELRRISGATDGTYSDDVVACPETLDGNPFVVGTDGCFGDGEHAFHGAEFPYLAANVVSKETGDAMLPPYQVFDVPGGRKVALIGVVTETTPGIVSPAGITDVTFIDEADAVNKYVPELTRRGVEAIGVLVHEGGTQSTSSNYDGCTGLAGPIVDINDRISDEVDLIVSAHTHQAYNCRLAVPGGQPRLVTSAGHYGRLVSDIRLTLDGRTGEVNRAATYQATNVPVRRTAPDAGVQAVVDYWVAKSAEAGNKVVGSVTADIKRAYVTKPDPKTGQPVTSEDRESESSLGNFVAQTQLAATQEEAYGRPVIAFMNPGGLRTDILFAGSPAGEGNGNVTYKEVFDVLPFGNTVGAVTLTGAQIKEALEEQFIPRPPRAQLILGTSEGFSYSYDPTQPLGSKVIADSIKLNGVTLDAGTSYRVAVPNFLISGGDSFTVFGKGSGIVTGPVDVDAAVAYFKAHSPVSPPAANHVTKIG